MAGITQQGFEIKTREEILTDINTRMQTSFGASFDVSPSSPDGQVIGIVADAVHECWLREEAAYNNFIPSKAFGQGLDDLVSLNGVSRIVDRPTTVLVSLTGNAGLVIPEGSIVETVEGLQFKTNATVILPSDVTATCLTLGAIPVGANEVTVINTDNEITGWTGVDNTEAGVTGVVKQTDAELRAYRNANTISRGVNTSDAIYQAVANLNLEHIYIDDNNTDAIRDGVPAGTVHVVAEGGNRQEIAQAIFRNMPAAIPTHGTITESVLDIAGHPHDINFDRPTETSIEVVAVVEVADDAVHNVLELAETAVVNHIQALNIGGEVVWSRLFTPLLSITGITVRSVTVAIQGNAQGSADIAISQKSRAVTNTTLVSVTE